MISLATFAMTSLAVSVTATEYPNAYCIKRTHYVSADIDWRAEVEALADRIEDLTGNPRLEGEIESDPMRKMFAEMALNPSFEYLSTDQQLVIRCMLSYFNFVSGWLS